jgi:hypothetical protein
MEVAELGLFRVSETRPEMTGKARLHRLTGRGYGCRHAAEILAARPVNSLSSFPRIDDGRTGAFEIPRIPGNYDQVVGKRGRRDQ